MTEQHHIYHWKHGWIPLTHAAAMSKAKGNSKLADKFVPGASHHHDAHIATHGMSAAQIHAMGAHRNHSDAAAVARLRNGDHALVHGMDEHGQPVSIAGTAHGTPTLVRIRQGRNGPVEHHLAVSMHNGSDQTTVYVKNPDQVTAEQAHRDRVIKSMEAYNRPTADQARKAGKVQVRAGTYQGQAGHHVVGTDTKGRSVKVFVPGERRHAEAARDNIKAGRPAFSPPMTDSQRTAAIAATQGGPTAEQVKMTTATLARSTGHKAADFTHVGNNDYRHEPTGKVYRLKGLPRGGARAVEQKDHPAAGIKDGYKPDDKIDVNEWIHGTVVSHDHRGIRFNPTRGDGSRSTTISQLHPGTRDYADAMSARNKPAAPAVPRSSSPRATRGSAGERITSHGPGFDHRAAEKKQATEAGQTSRAKINDEIKREWGDREVVGSIKDDASVPEVTRLIRNTPGMKLAGLDRVDVEKVDGAIPGFMVEIPSQNRKLFVPTRRGVDTALRRANSRPAGDSVIHHDGVAYTHSPGMGGIVHNQMGGYQVGMINPHPDGDGFLVHTTSGFGAPKPGEPGYLPEHRVDTMKQAIAGLHVADRMQQNHRAAESGKRAAEAAALKDSMAGRVAQDNERNALIAKIKAASPADRPSFPAATVTGTHEERMAALRKMRSEQIVAAEAERARQDTARKSHFRVAPAKPSHTTRDTATMQASRDKLTTALDRAPLDVRAVGEDGFAALREGSAISVGGHVGHVIQKQGNDVLSYHPPTAQHRQGRYYRHTRRKGRNGLTETGAWESNARA